MRRGEFSAEITRPMSKYLSDCEVGGSDREELRR